MSRALPLLLALLLPACAPARSGAAATDEAEETDPLGLAALLLADGHHDRARVVLAKVDPKADGVDPARLLTLRGLAALKADDPKAARADLQAATALGQAEPVAWVYLAQACYALEDLPGTLAALDARPEGWARLPGLHRLRVHAAWRAGDRTSAFAALAAAEAAFPKDADFTKQRLLYLLELGLFQEAAVAGERYLASAGQSVGAHLALGEALRRARRPEAAAAVLEEARLRWPGDEQVLLALARAHHDAGRPRAAGAILEEAALRSPTLLADAAELYRRAGALDRSLLLNVRMGDSKAKTRQRLGLLLQKNQFDEAAALEPRATRLGLLEDDDVRYALAYASYRAGDLERAQELARGVTKASLFRSATDLVRAIEVEKAGETR
jgi:tetratricopeptide (TPR) repeat protein